MARLCHGSAPDSPREPPGVCPFWCDRMRAGELHDVEMEDRDADPDGEEDPKDDERLDQQMGDVGDNEEVRVSCTHTHRQGWRGVRKGCTHTGKVGVG